MVKKPMKNSVIHRDATWMRSCANHAYAITDSGRNTIAGLVLSKRIYALIRAACSVTAGDETCLGQIVSVILVGQTPQCLIGPAPAEHTPEYATSTV